jgi:hypothetical protein
MCHYMLFMHVYASLPPSRFLSLCPSLPPSIPPSLPPSLPSSLLVSFIHPSIHPFPSLLRPSLPHFLRPFLPHSLTLSLPASLPSSLMSTSACIHACTGKGHLRFAWFAGAAYLSLGILCFSLSAARNGTDLPLCPTNPPFPFQNVVPYIVIHIIFGLMWWLREINIQNESFIERAGNSLQLTPAGLEGTCGWASLRDSQSGRLQASYTRVFGELDLRRCKCTFKVPRVAPICNHVRRFLNDFLELFLALGHSSDIDQDKLTSSLMEQAVLILYCVPSLGRLAWVQVSKMRKALLSTALAVGYQACLLLRLSS